MNILAACAGRGLAGAQVRLQVLRPLYGCEQDDPAFFTEAMRRPHPPRDADRARHRRGRGVGRATSPSKQPRRRRHRAALRQRARARRADLATPGCSSLPLVPMILGFDPRYQFVHEDDIVARPRARRRATASPASSTSPPTACSRSRRWSALLGKRAAAGPAAVGHRTAARAAARALGVRIPPEMLNQLRFGRGIDNRRYKATGFEYGYTTRGDGRSPSPSTCGCSRSSAASSPAYRYEREVEEFLRRSPLARPPAPPTTRRAARRRSRSASERRSGRGRSQPRLHRSATVWSDR